MSTKKTDQEIIGEDEQITLGDQTIAPDTEKVAAPEDIEKIAVIFIAHCKHNNDLYKPDDRLEVDEDTLKVLTAAKVIRLPER